MRFSPDKRLYSAIWLYGYSVIFKTWSAPADSKLCFRLTKTGRFNGVNAAKPYPPDAPEIAAGSTGIYFRGNAGCRLPDLNPVFFDFAPDAMFRVEIHGGSLIKMPT